jgi:hypothetical protein
VLRRAALALGALLVGIGALGFLPSFSTLLRSTTGEAALHAATGAALLAAAALGRPRPALLAAGALYAALTWLAFAAPLLLLAAGLAASTPAALLRLAMAAALLAAPVWAAQRPVDTRSQDRA